MEWGPGSEKEVTTKLRTILTWTAPGRLQIENF